MSTFTIDELDREEIEFLPSRVVMTTCNPCCRPSCWEPCEPTIRVCVKVQVCCLVGISTTAQV